MKFYNKIHPSDPRDDKPRQGASKVAAAGKAKACMAAAVCVLLATACQSTGDDIQSTDDSLLELPSYVEEEEEQESEYNALEKVELATEDAVSYAYAITDDAGEDEGAENVEDEISSSSNGISLSSRLYSDPDHAVDVGDILLNEFNSIYGALCEDKNVEDIQVYDAVSEDTYTIQQITYNLRDGHTIYPCAVYIKVDTVTNHACLATTIILDNSQTDDHTSDVLQDVLDAYGIVLE